MLVLAADIPFKKEDVVLLINFRVGDFFLPYTALVCSG
jgi:hypothetical protein